MSILQLHKRVRSLTTSVGITTLAISFGAGCGGPPSGPTRYTISGTVTFDKQPVPKGFITFAPDDTAGNKGPGGGAEVINGKFKTEVSKGVVGGPHIVQIVAYDGISTKVEGEELPDGKSLFPTYTTTVNFPKQDTVTDFDVPKP